MTTWNVSMIYKDLITYEDTWHPTEKFEAPSRTEAVQKFIEKFMSGDAFVGDRFIVFEDGFVGEPVIVTLTGFTMELNL